MPSNSNQLEMLWVLLKTSQNIPNYDTIKKTVGEITISNHGDISSEVLKHSHYEEFFLWNIFCYCLKKNYIQRRVSRIRLTLSADSEFPYCIQYLLKQPCFKSLNLLSLRRPLPIDFWKICHYFSVKNGQVHWNWTILASQKNVAACHYNRLKSLGKMAKLKDINTSKIRYLYIWNQSLTHLPNELSKLKNLEHLEIWNNPIQEFPASFQELRNLKMIVLSKNQKFLAPQIKKRLPHTQIGWA